MMRADRIVYTTCMCNCGSNHQCVLKAHVKNGKVVAVEPDDRYNTGIGREDEVLSEQELIKTKLQRRPCTRGLAFHKYLYHPDRILYPLMRDPKSKRGEGKYVRISWDEALATIANKMIEVRENYGPYSVITPYMPNAALERLFSFWGAGVDSWGWCSWDATRLMVHIVAGTEGWEYSQYGSGSAPDMLANSKLIVIWGFDPTMGSSGPGYQFAWFVKLARERGKKVIIFDPRYSVAAEVLADQWIPIKPGTDHAMFLAMAYVFFKEDLWDKNFVARYVEHNGFERWRNYVLGKEDGIEKTPEWAEIQCAVPAKTIQELARLVATVKPAWLTCHWGVSRKSHGEQTVKTFAGLQAMLGYWGTPGAGPSLHLGPERPIPWRAPWGARGEYNVPKMYRSHYWAQAVLLLDRVRKGELNEKDYMRMVGWRADPSLVRDFNPKVLLWGGGQGPHASDHLVTACESPNFQVKAFDKMELIATTHSIMTATTRYADIILPAQDWMWEEKNIAKSEGYGGFESINYCPGVVEPAGEVRPWVWIYTKLAEKLGVDPQKYFKYYTTDENWDRDWERYLMDCYQGVVYYYRKRNVKVPSWEEFTQGRFINCDELDDKPFTGWDEQIKGGKPFKTESGRIELWSNYIAHEENRGKGEHYDSFGRLYANLPSDWGPLTPAPIYRRVVRGMDDPLAREYPLMQISPHSRYRVHYLFWEHPWLRGHVYQHRVWISTTDAKTRGIRDGDLVTVYNDRGKIVMPAYVTSRIMPGIIAIRHGGKYVPDKEGVDIGASPSTTLGGDFESCITPAKAHTLVQVKKYDAPASRSVK
jgi:anaerobic dimethyl sulfoxide reductase subunit A